MRNPTSLPQNPALPLHQGVPNLQPLSVHAPPPPPLSILFKGIGVPSILHSDVRAHDPLLW